MIFGLKSRLEDIVYSLEFDQDEFEMAIKGETIKRETACAEMSGIWEVKFKKFSKAKHQKLFGG